MAVGRGLGNGGIWGSWEGGLAICGSSGARRVFGGLGGQEGLVIDTLLRFTAGLDRGERLPFILGWEGWCMGEVWVRGYPLAVCLANRHPTLGGRKTELKWVPRKKWFEEGGRRKKKKEHEKNS